MLMLRNQLARWTYCKSQKPPQFGERRIDFANAADLI